MTWRPTARANNTAATIAANKNALAIATTDSPLGYALRVMRDDKAPMNLRVSMAKAALPYLHWRLPTGEPPQPQADAPEMSRTEIARRIAFLLDSTDDGNDGNSPSAPVPQPQQPVSPAIEVAPAPDEPARKPYAPPPVHYITDEVRRDQIVSPRSAPGQSYSTRAGYRRMRTSQ
jgi:hypothetical protein